MNSHHLLIQKSVYDPEYLDGYDGIQWEWTTQRKTAWRLRRDEAEKKLKLMEKEFPKAVIVEV